ncbi:MAG: peptidase domain-containing ABC transporter [Bacteroidales bacterium]|nr:peptidase domain-containing ABC transporter [Bacteroidales bacterium]
MFPHYRQLDTMDCGPTCLKIIAEYYGRHYDIESLRAMCHITKEGVSLLGISYAAEALGLHSTGVELTFDQLVQEATLPCIIHWRQSHFVVVYKIERKRNKLFVNVSDPALGLLRYSREQFEEAWGENAEDSLGMALLLDPTPAFYTNKGKTMDRIHTSFSDLIKYLRPYNQFIVQLIFLMLTGSIISLILPFLSQSMIDEGISTGNRHFVMVILIAQMSMILGQLANNLIRSWLMLHMTTRISIVLISDFLSKLMRLPVSFFDSRKTGDIIQRIGDHSRIQSFLTGALLSMGMAIMTLLIYSIVMGLFDIRILSVFLFGSALYIAWVMLFMKKRRNLDYLRFQESATNQSTIMQIVNGMQEIKLNNCEKIKRWEWERIQSRLFNVSVKSLSLGQVQQIGGTFIDQIKNLFISYLSATAVIDGNITFGMMTAVQFIIGQLNSPISQLIGFFQSAQDAKLSFERLSEINDMKEELITDKRYCESIPDKSNIEFSRVSYQYGGPLGDKVLDNVSVFIPFNKTTAIVGASGSGKTTMLKLMLGFYKPVEGTVLLGGRPVVDYPPELWRAMCGTVMQDGYIFSDSIERNISMGDENPLREKIKNAARIANIDEYIEKLPLGYNTIIGTEGIGLSNGQKQRILIARAVYKNARYIFFDEATNSLDANNEEVIIKRLNTYFRGKTVVIVAHRLSTVKNADNIIVLDKGRIVEQGTHNELSAKKGYYYSLVKNQLELGN